MDIGSIQKRIERLETLQNENKVSQELLKSELENDENYINVTKDWKEITTKKKRIKEEILIQAENKKILEDIKENAEEISTLKQILSTELMEVYQKENTDQITDHNGQLRKFAISVKLLPKGASLKDLREDK